MQSCAPVRRFAEAPIFLDARFFVHIALLFVVLGMSFLSALGAKQKKNTKDQNAELSAKDEKKAAASTESANDGRLGDSLKPEDIPSSDFVPCKLTIAELKMLQKPEMAQTLSPARVDQLQASVVAAVMKKNPDPAMTGPWMSDLVETLSNKATSNSLIGLTPSQALGRILELVRTTRDKAATQTDIDWYVSHIMETVRKRSEGGPSVTTPAIAKGTDDAMKASGSDSANAPTADLGPLIKRLNEIAANNQIASDDKKAIDKTASDDRVAIDKLTVISNASAKNLTLRSALYSAVTSAVLKSGIEAGMAGLILQNLQQGSPLEVEDLIDAARKFLLQLERPQDIGCSMSLLTWREVEFAFGYLIANEYVAVQVVVRNLSDKEQFVLHDVEFEVDADPTGRLGRYYSGRDKVVVRALANTQATGDPRNITLSVATGIGQIMSSAQTVFGGQLADATGVFNGGFMSGLKNGWKDLSGDQMKMIDDNTFSSTPSSQTVVPKQGTVVFYTFIPSKQFEEGWWTQPCVETMYEGRLDSGGRLSNLSRGTYGQQVKAGATVDEPTGVDVRRALEICARLKEAPDRQHSLWGTMWKRGVLLETPSKGDLQSLWVPEEEENSSKATKPNCENKEVCDASGKGVHCKESDDKTAKSCQTDWPTSPTIAYELFRPAYRRPYKKWSGNSLAIFRELANTVVAGVHTMEDIDSLPSVTALDCGTQVDSKGTVDFSKVTSDTLSCTLNGKNLSSLPKVRLRNAGDAADDKYAESAVTVVGDPTKATVSWPVATLHGLPGTTYLLYGVTISSAEQKTNGALHLPDTPFATAVTNESVGGTLFDFTDPKAKAQTLTVTGNHLDKVTGLILTPAVDTNVQDAATAQTSEAKKKASDDLDAKTATVVKDQQEVATAKTKLAAAQAASAKDKTMAANAKNAKMASDNAEKALTAAKAAVTAASNAVATAGQTTKTTGSLTDQTAGRHDTAVISVVDSKKQSLTQVTFSLDTKVLATLGSGGATLKLQPADDSKPTLGITVKLPPKK